MGLFRNNSPDNLTLDSRQKRHQKRRVILLVIFSLIILLLSLFSFIIFHEAITSCKNGISGNTDNTTVDTTVGNTNTTAGVDSTAVTTTSTSTITEKSCFSCTGSKLSSDTTDKNTAEDKTLTYNADKYVYKSNDDIKIGELLLIDNDHLYQFPDSTPNIYSLFDYRTVYPDNIRSIQAIDYTKPSLDITAINALNAMADAFYAATGETGLQAKFGYCTQAQQQGYFDTAVTKYGSVESAKLHEALAGGTEHNTGLAIDLGVYINGTTYKLSDTALEGKYDWIFENCYKYGFVLRYPDTKASITGIDYEPYHFRYVGYEHAYYMYNNNLCFEEYLNLLRTSYTCTADNVATSAHLCITGDNGLKYEIYYVAASAAMTTIPVPENAPYTISGDNVSGFIVSVTIS